MAHALIVEDDHQVASTMIDLLSRMGLSSFSVAATEAEAVAAATACPPALLTVDIALREGSGLAAVARIRQLHGRLPVLYVTATPLAIGDDPEAVALAKPFRRAALADAVAYLMG